MGLHESAVNKNDKHFVLPKYVLVLVRTIQVKMRMLDLERIELKVLVIMMMMEMRLKMMISHLIDGTEILYLYLNPSD